MMLADAGWLAHHRQHSSGKLVVFYASPKNKTFDFDFLFCARPKTREIVAVGRIQNQVLIHQDKAWAKYSNALGASLEVEWRQQAQKVLKNSIKTYQGEIVAIETIDFRFFPDEISPEKAGIEVTSWQSKKSLNEITTSHLLEIFQVPPEDNHLDDEFGMDPSETGYKEGKAKARLHLSKERNRGLVKAAKEQWSQHSNGKLPCEVCDFSFSVQYGRKGQGFIEAHHKTPIATLTADTIVKITDLGAVCSNCHRMLHRHRPWLSIEELKAIIFGQRQK